MEFSKQEKINFFNKQTNRSSESSNKAAVAHSSGT